MAMLKATNDHYDGVIISSEHLPSDLAIFVKDLIHSLKEWAAQNKRGIWLNVPSNRASLVPAAIDEGFEFHHAKPGAVVMTKWLPNIPSTLPVALQYNVGVGAFILNDKQQVLMVQEANGILKNLNMWKFVTGLVDENEDICDAAAREVFEETSLRARFHRVISIRQSHGLAFGRSDLFFVCAMDMMEALMTKRFTEIKKAHISRGASGHKCHDGRSVFSPAGCHLQNTRLEEGQQEARMQDGELAAIRWFSMDELDALPLFQIGVFKTVLACCKEYAASKEAGFQGEIVENSFSKRKEFLMHSCSAV